MCLFNDDRDLSTTRTFGVGRGLGGNVWASRSLVMRIAYPLNRSPLEIRCNAVLTGIVRT